MGNVQAGYDPAPGRCRGHAQQGTVNLADAVQDRFGGRSLGIYVCRNVGGTGDRSVHGDGRAYDHQWTKKASGFVIADKLIEKHAELGVQLVIWWERIWSWPRRVEGWRVYDGESPHKDHIHMEQNRSGAAWLQYADAYAAIGEAVPIPEPAPFQREDELAMLPRCVHFKGAIFLVGYDTEPFDIIDPATGNAVGTAVGPWRKTFPNVSRLAQVVGGGGCVTDRGNAFEVTNAEFEAVYQHRGIA